ncbi:hypothetical protein M8C21_017033 [Ambrosia artemisiifolia]|uniref:Uncharacterized protein n=1 Tax=Ambrosia artemisiifolia TaxID=4212 RepID=A0AAD5C2S8_AMBAR|nr:hypothetical protein M8C21_017033 [Ambrosia artemisiifolia]
MCMMKTKIFLTLGFASITGMLKVRMQTTLQITSWHLVNQRLATCLCQQNLF